jgi:nicotinamidase-related amidase
MRDDRRTTVLGFLALGIGVAFDHAEAGAAGQSTALLVLDMQRDFLRADGRYPVDRGQAEQVIAAVNRLISLARKRGWPTMAIVNAYAWWDPNNLTRNFAAVAGSPGGAIDPRVQLAAPTFSKREPNAFSNPDLLKRLRDLGVRRVIIAGVYADACVAATARGALRVGLTPIVIADAVASRSEAARTRALTTLKGAGVGVATCAELARA